MLDARKNEVYTALYQITDRATVLTADRVCAPSDFLNTITAPTIFLGDGALRYQELIRHTLGSNACLAPLISHVPRPSYGCLLAETAFQNGLAVSPELLLPTYLRASEAELSRQHKI